MNQINLKAYFDSSQTIYYEDLIDINSDELVKIESGDVIHFLSVVQSILMGRSLSVLLLSDNICENDYNLNDLPTNHISVFTSGTTGTPKLKSIKVSSLIERVSDKIELGELVGCSFDINKFAALQTAFAVLKNKACYVNLSENTLSLSQIKLNRLSTTPSWFNFNIICADNSDFDFGNLRTVTLGGESSNSKVLTWIKSKLPDCSVVQIYASTESGTLFSIKDGLPGISLEYAKHLVKEGRLDWSQELSNLRDGDSVELLYYDINDKSLKKSDDFFILNSNRLVFKGRGDDVLNIGGINVSLITLENFVMDNFTVEDCVAKTISNPIVGNLIYLELVINASVNFNELKKDAVNLIKHELGKQYTPFKFLSVTSIKYNSNGKKIR